MDSQDSSFYPIIAHRTFTDPRNFDNLPARYKQLVLNIIRRTRGEVDWSCANCVEVIYSEARAFRIAKGWFDFGLLDNTIEVPATPSPCESVASNDPDYDDLFENNWP